MWIWTKQIHQESSWWDMWARGASGWCCQYTPGVNELSGHSKLWLIKAQSAFLQRNIVARRHDQAIEQFNIGCYGFSEPSITVL